MHSTLMNVRLLPDPFGTNRNIARAYEGITRFQNAGFELQDQLSHSRKLLDEAYELLAKIERELTR